MTKHYTEWDLSEWLSHLELRTVQEIQLGLTRIDEVARKLYLKNPGCPVITVAGTNGKGSTVSALQSIYQHSGYQVGTYTSPHLMHFNERICVNLTPIAAKDLCKAFCSIEEARGQTELTYFEMATLAALWYFKTQALDLIILEVGLGGRLDATNIIDADVSIITTIDYDHQEFLGTTLEAIGYEKAGILRKEKPFIYADENPPTSVLDVAASLATSSFLFDKHYSIKEQQDRCWTFTCGTKELTDLPMPSLQLKSAAAAIMVTQIVADKLFVPEKAVYAALQNVFIPGRLQWQEGATRVLYDVSHNPQSVKLLAKTLGSLENTGKVHAVFSALKDKDILGLITPLREFVDYWYPAQVHAKRGAEAATLLSHFKDAEIFVEFCYNNPLSAFETALNHAQSGDLIVVYGSFYTVSHVMAAKLN